LEYFLFRAFRTQVSS